MFENYVTDVLTIYDFSDEFSPSSAEFDWWKIDKCPIVLSRDNELVKEPNFYEYYVRGESFIISEVYKILQDIRPFETYPVGLYRKVWVLDDEHLMILKMIVPDIAK